MININSQEIKIEIPKNTFPSNLIQINALQRVILPYTLFPQNKETSAIISSHANVGKVRISLWNALASTIPYIETTLDTEVDTEKLCILDVACGDGIYAQVLGSYFEKKPFGTEPSGKVKYTGIDIDRNLIEKARKENSPPNFSFIHGDATRLTENPQLQEHYAIVTILHQNSDIDPKIWKEIFREAYKKVRRGGILIVTSYNLHEHSTMLEIFRRDLKIAPTISQENPLSYKPKEIPTDFGYAKFIAVFTK